MRLRSCFCALAFFIAAVSAHAGAWGYKSFENDDALDWVANDLKRGGQRALEQTIAAVAKGRGYLEAPHGSSAIAACEVLAAAQGRGSPDLPKEVAALAKGLSPKPSEEVRKNARDALDRILGRDSELSALWKEAGENFARWKKTVEELRSRI